MPVSVVVLAAGQGKRMHSALPKVLQPLAGRPLLEHVVRAARAIQPAGIHIVYGHGAEQVRAAFAEQTDLKWALQAEQLGTGHAVVQAMPAIPDDHRVLVLCGDVPLIRPETLERLVGDGAGGKLALLTALLDDATGYGRVLRNESGDVTRIVEHKDATDDERRVNEINTGLIAFDARAVAPLPRQLEEQQRAARVLPDRRHRDGRSPTKSKSTASSPSRRPRCSASTTARSSRPPSAPGSGSKPPTLMARGVTLADPERIDVRGEVIVGRDVFIDVGVVLEGKVVLGDRVRIGPYAVHHATARSAPTRSCTRTPC